MMDRAALKDDLRREEGFKSYGYFDNLGYLTIGYGRMIDKRLGGGITATEAEYLLDNDITKAIDDLTAHFPWFSKMADARKRALVEMAFQLGLSRLLTFKKMLIALGNGQYKEAALQALDSTWAKQTPGRAARVAALIQNG